MIVWHGTNVKFDKFKKSTKRISNDLYGGGISYFTTDKNIAIGYAKARVSAYGGKEFLFKVNLTLHNVFDVDKIYTGKELLNIITHTKDIESFARSSGLLGYGEDKYLVIIRLNNGTTKLTGDKIWKGLSRGGILTMNAQETLQKAGYDGLRYNGGVLTSDSHSHDVYMPYKEDSIHIETVTEIRDPHKIITPKDHPVDKQGIVEEKLRGNIQPGLNLNREDLPQIKNPLEFCKSNRINYKYIKLPVESLRPIQNDYDYDKIRAIGKSPNKKPIVVSRDNHILDGHHRWVSHHIKKNKDIDTIQLDKNILDLLAISKRDKLRK